MNRLARVFLGRAGWALLSVGLVGCAGNDSAQTQKPVSAAGPPVIEAVRVVEQPVNVTLSMPGELQPYQTVAIFPRVTGFVKDIRVDRGSEEPPLEVIADREEPENLAEPAAAQSKVNEPD